VQSSYGGLFVFSALYAYSVSQTTTGNILVVTSGEGEGWRPGTSSYPSGRVRHFRTSAGSAEATHAQAMRSTQSDRISPWSRGVAVQ